MDAHYTMPACSSSAPQFALRRTASKRYNRPISSATGEQTMNTEKQAGARSVGEAISRKRAVRNYRPEPVPEVATVHRRGAESAEAFRLCWTITLGQHFGSP